ncbi:MAG TPA: SRPBCC domain-containing protein, partial [Pseudomonadales bacterium]|nr:SRPBCC domain-containing protein [Pseudomonadales bacterium]
MEKIVSTSTLVGGWRPAPDAWLPMTAIITMSDEDGGTRYHAHVMHQNKAGRDQHEQMGFFEGWGICIQQLDDYALGLRH